MVDFVKVIIKKQDVPSDILFNRELNFTRPINSDTGEINKKINFREAYFKNLRFRLYDSGHLLLSGSFHKFHNDGIHNYNSFSKANLDEVLSELEDVFGLDLDKCTIKNLEIGLNITPPINSKTVVKNILLHSKEPFKYYSIKGAEYKQAIHQRYYIKAYDKRLMYCNKTYINSNGRTKEHKIKKEIFRFELKFVKMQILNNIGIYSLSDLKSTIKLRLALELLCETWDSLTMYDTTIREKNLSNYVKNTKLNQWQNTNYWYDLPKQRRLEQKKALESIIRIHSNNVKAYIHKKLKLEIIELLFDLNKKDNDNSLPLNQECKEYNSLLPNTSNIGFKGNILSNHFNVTSLTI